MKTVDTVEGYAMEREDGGMASITVQELMQWVRQHGLGTRFWFKKARGRARLLTSHYGPILEGDSISQVCEIVGSAILKNHDFRPNDSE